MSPHSSPSSSSSSYGGSGASIYNEESPITAIVDQINAAFDPLPLDRAQAAQAQLSGLLRAQTQELQQLRKQLAETVPEHRELALRAKKLGKSIAADLDWLNKHLTKLETSAKAKYPIEYQEARDRIENPIQ